MAAGAKGRKLGRNKKKCERYGNAYRYEANRDRRGKARAKRLAKRGAEMRDKREARALASHRKRHLLKHGLPATEACLTCKRASL